MALERAFGHEVQSAVNVSTVDGFQGQEKEIIIFSAVRSGTRAGIGFLSDLRRMNVALTRAKCSLFVVANANALSKNEYWDQLVQDAKQKNTFKDVCEWLFDEIDLVVDTFSSAGPYATLWKIFSAVHCKESIWKD